MALFKFYDALTARLRAAGEYVWPLGLRVILAWEFGEAGMAKLRGDNWFADIPWADWQKGFPFPFSELPAWMNWQLATWGELVLAGMLLAGLFTRFAAFSLIVITGVATAAVHWPAEWESLSQLWQGYVITADGAGNYKLPLLFILMLLPLVFHSGGRLSLDHLLVMATGRERQLEDFTRGLQSTGLAFLILGVAIVWVEPLWGGSLLGLALLALAIPEMTGKT
jgi:putative oxidoreductase